MAQRSLWENFTFATLPRDARLTYLGLEAFADDLGNVFFEPPQVRSMLYHYDEATDEQVAQWLEALIKNGMVIPYDVQGRRFATLPKTAKPKTAKHVVFPLAPGQTMPARKHEELPPPTVPDALKFPLDTFLAFVRDKTARKQISDAKRLLITRAIVDIAEQFGVKSAIHGIHEAIKHDAANERYIRAVAANAPRDGAPELRLVSGGDADAKPQSLTELRRARGAHR